MCGYSNDKIYPKRKSSLKWEKLNTILDDNLFDTIEKMGVDGERKNLTRQQKLSFYKPLAFPADYDAEKAKVASPAFELLLIFIQAACDYRSADVAFRKSEYEKEKAAAAEAGETFSKPPLTEIDDDCEE